MEIECEPVQLEPFVHQVGGHSSVLCFDAHTLCKPLVSREHRFYKTMPEELREFAPEYKGWNMAEGGLEQFEDISFGSEVSGVELDAKGDVAAVIKYACPTCGKLYARKDVVLRHLRVHTGVVEVAFQEDSKGYLNLVAYPLDERGCRKASPYAGNSPSSGGDTAQSDSDSEASSSEQTPPKQKQSRFRVKRSGSIEIEPKSKAIFELVNPMNEDEDSRMSAHNPWSLRCHRLQLAKMKKVNPDNESHKFILLENLASHLKLPCILDLKMGTRQHGDDSSEEKRIAQMLKCEQSTSGTLGVRICGMQVYQTDTDRYVCHDKYYGRQLTVQGFYQTLYQFLHDGVRLRTSLLEPIIARLQKLYHLLKHVDTFRFYSSSLLIMYDGRPETSCPVHSRSGKPPQNSHDQSTDHPECPRSPEPYHESARASTSQGYSADYFSAGASSPASCDHLQGPTTSVSCSCVHRDSTIYPQVDIRMIDFAHTTHKGFNRTDEVHSGPDKGYLLGLESLIKAFRRLLEHGTAQEHPR